MKLPSALAPWSTELAIFPEDVAIALGALARRLAVATGNWGTYAGVSAEPDGYDGVSQRGPIERLLLSEWAVADEYPDEFFRRSVAGEHAFLRTAFQSSTRSKCSTLLLDCGPEQLGRARIVQLALLVVLSRRAAQAHAHFRWQLVPSSDPSFIEDFRTSSVHKFLGGRSAVRPSRAALSEAIELLAKEGCEDIWVAGGRSLSHLSWPAQVSRVDIRENLDPESRSVDVSVRAAGGTERRVRLELPDDALCARLLRDPFSTATAVRETTRVRGPVNSPLLFGAGWRRVFALTTNELLGFSLTNSPKAQPGKTRRHALARGEAPFALGWVEKAPVLFSLAGSEVLIRSPKKPLSLLHNAREYRLPLGELEQGVDVDRPTFGQALRTSSGLGWVLCLPGGLLVRLSLDHSIRTPVELIADGVTAWRMDPNGSQPSFVARPTSRWGAQSFGSRDGFGVLCRQSGKNPGITLLDGAGPLTARFHLHCDGELRVAIEHEPQTWTLHEGTTTRRLSLPVGDEVLGVYVPAARSPAKPDAGLVVLQRDRRTVVALGRNWSRTLCPSLPRIRFCAMSEDGEHLAYLTEDGTFSLFLLRNATPLYHVDVTE
jgi:hypothetical protein